MIDIIEFRPVKRSENSLVGFISFKWNNEFEFTDVPVHQLLGKKKIRLLYLDDARPKGKVYKQILEEINSYVLAQYGDILI